MMAKLIADKWGRLLAAALLASFGSQWAIADRVQIESAVVESASGTTSAISRSNGNVDTFFTMQKKMVYDTLVGIGIPLNSLPPEIRTRLAQFETRNFEAFRAFCVGLNAQDEGRFADAKAAFRRAVELDPSFGMAKAKESAMPQSDAVNSIQLQAVLRDAVKNATQTGKDSVAVDVQHAIAAMQAGMTVVVGQAPAVAPEQNQAATDSLANPPGSGDKYGSRTVVGVSYYTDVAGVSVGVASTTDWSANQVKKNGSQLVSVGDSANFVARLDAGKQSNGFLPNTTKIDPAQVGTYTLTDGTVVNWGAWNSSPGASALVTVSGSLARAPQLGPTLNYMMALSTPSMPTTQSAVTLDPIGGNFKDAKGQIVADFGLQQVTIKELGFSLEKVFDSVTKTFVFSGLNGQASYGAKGSGFFSGNYSAGGSCTGCTNFSPTSSAFTGNFVGKNANGLIFSSIMQTGSGTVSGVHLFAPKPNK
jgi:hypothetical protein